MSSEPLFDQYVDNYEDALRQGLRLTGESRDYFARRRVEWLARSVAGAAALSRIVDFGCGLGHTTPYLLAAFPNARITGFDSAPAVISDAQRAYGGGRACFRHDRLSDLFGQVDLAYCNGVFHHVPVADRLASVRLVCDWLKPGGLFAIWENNPWNPGTRWVMSRIPFDRDAITLSYRETRNLLESVGLVVEQTTFHFYFPGALKWLRPVEALLRRLPLGGQYCVVGRKPLGEPRTRSRAAE